MRSTEGGRGLGTPARLCCRCPSGGDGDDGGVRAATLAGDLEAVVVAEVLADDQHTPVELVVEVELVHVGAGLQLDLALEALDHVAALAAPDELLGDVPQ